MKVFGNLARSAREGYDSFDIFPEPMTEDQVVDTSLGVVYLSLYLQRHSALLQSFSTQVIDWNKGLFQEERKV